jgi:ribosomal protein S18 acetylase RimI-like enzyme
MSQNFAITKASSADVPRLSVLVNSAYRGEGSKKGWTTEADLLGGQRTDENGLQKMIDHPAAAILKYTDAQEQIVGCVYLEKKPAGLYLGMLTVSPELQGAGIGKHLLAAAEAYAKETGCSAIIMTVISVRAELIAWYERHGYQRTGETQPFPADPAFGLPKQSLEFIVLQKPIR